VSRLGTPSYGSESEKRESVPVPSDLVRTGSAPKGTEKSTPATRLLRGLEIGGRLVGFKRGSESISVTGEFSTPRSLIKKKKLQPQ